MTYSQLQIKDASGVWQDWNGQLQTLADGTLGSVKVASSNEGKVTRDEAHDVTLPVSATTDLVSHSVPVGKVHAIRGYAFTHDNSNVDKFTVLQDATTKATIYTATYKGGLLPEYLLVDNTAGSVPIVVKVQAHNNDGLVAHKGSAYILAEDVTNKQAPAYL